MEQKIFDGFLHSFVRFVFWCAGRLSEARCWIVNWSPSGSMVLATFETLAKQEIQLVVCNALDQMGGFGGQRSNGLHPVYHLSSNNFLMHPRTSRRLLLRSAIISSAAQSCGRKRLRQLLPITHIFKRKYACYFLQYKRKNRKKVKCM